jgi:micrococcal nuclease
MLWNKAKDYLQNLILYKNVYIEYDKTQARTDRYWRHLIYVFYSWKNINQEMIEVWLAKEYTYNKPYKYQKEFKQAQKIAQSKKLWIWWLSKNIQKKVINNIDNHNDNLYNNCKIKWNINSKWKKIYHLPWCKSYKQTKIDISKWEKWFCTEVEAQKADFTKAGNCD